MILVDTSVWIDHFRRSEPRLADMLAQGRVVMHPFVLGEVAMGRFPQWDLIIAGLNGLAKVEPVSEDQWLSSVRRHCLSGTGLGFVDSHLLAAVDSIDGLRLWTRDRRLAARAVEAMPEVLLEEDV